MKNLLQPQLKRIGMSPEFLEISKKWRSSTKKTKIWQRDFSPAKTGLKCVSLREISQLVTLSWKMQFVPSPHFKSVNKYLSWTNNSSISKVFGISLPTLRLASLKCTKLWQYSANTRKQLWVEISWVEW